MKRRLGSVAITTLALAVGGCGGSSGPSKAAYIKSADAICKSGNDKIVAAAAALPTGATNAQKQAFVVSTVVPGLTGELTQLRALSTPSADKAKIGAIYDALNADVQKLAANPSLINTSATSPFADANAKALAYGMKICGAS